MGYDWIVHAMNESMCDWLLWKVHACVNVMNDVNETCMKWMEACKWYLDVYVSMTCKWYDDMMISHMSVCVCDMMRVAYRGLACMRELLSMFSYAQLAFIWLHWLWYDGRRYTTWRGLCGRGRPRVYPYTTWRSLCGWGKQEYTSIPPDGAYVAGVKEEYTARWSRRARGQRDMSRSPKMSDFCISYDALVRNWADFSWY